jgi:hypothetical protein
MRDARYPLTKQEEHTGCLAANRLGTLPSLIAQNCQTVHSGMRDARYPMTKQEEQHI